MNYEPTINGLTKKAARQLGDAYQTIAESFEVINGMSANSAESARMISKMSRDISEYNNRVRVLKRENEQLKSEYAAMREYCNGFAGFTTGGGGGRSERDASAVVSAAVNCDKQDFQEGEACK